MLKRAGINAKELIEVRKVYQRQLAEPAEDEGREVTAIAQGKLADRLAREYEVEPDVIRACFPVLEAPAKPKRRRAASAEEG